MSFLRHGEIFPVDGGAGFAANASTSRLDEFPASYSLAVCSPAWPASASPAIRSVQSLCLAGKQPANLKLSLISVSQTWGAVHPVPDFRSRLAPRHVRENLSCGGKVRNRPPRFSRSSTRSFGDSSPPGQAGPMTHETDVGWCGEPGTEVGFTMVRKSPRDSWTRSSASTLTCAKGSDAPERAL
jgi:hypothetical protein